MGMDIYGVADSLRGALEAWDTNNRRTGRSTNLIQSASDVDVIVVGHKSTQEAYLRELKRARKKSHVHAVFPKDFIDGKAVLPSTGSGGRVLFDHEWLRQYYGGILERAAARIETNEEPR